MLPTPENPQNPEKIIDKSWAEIRESATKTPYVDQYDPILKKLKEWKNGPHQPADSEPVDEKRQRQIEKVREFLSNSNFPFNAEAQPSTPPGNHNTKCFTDGRLAPTIGQETLTRLYLGVDDTKSGDTFIELVKALQSEGVLKDISLAFYEDTIIKNGEDIPKFKNVSHNTVVMYEPYSRPEVLDKILSAYRKVKKEHPDFFILTAAQQAKVYEANLINFKQLIDPNLAFVEMAPDDLGKSWEVAKVMDIYKKFGVISPSMVGIEGIFTSLRKYLGQSPESGVLTQESENKKSREGFKPNDVVYFKRKLKNPGLVQMSSQTIPSAV